MATKEPTTYPKISRKLWWLLRDRLKKSIPTVVTPTFIQSMAQMTEASARSNVLSPLRDLYLLSDDNKPTALASRWRHDDDYKAVCHEIREKVYPTDLVEAFPDPTSDRKDAIKTWFMKVGNVGEAAARMYADTYLLLSEGDPAKRQEEKPAVSSTPKPPRPARSAASQKTPAPAAPAPIATLRDPLLADPHPPSKRMPAIHIDVQVHISPDTTPEQIDKIFASMSKHLGSFVG
jgi:Family of unknown function (DUF5343)